MGQTTSSEARRSRHCCSGSPRSQPNKTQDTVKIDLAPSPDKGGRYGCFHPCSIVKENRDPSLGDPPAAPVVSENLPCPSVVVTDVSSTAATVLWSCSAAVEIQKMHLEVLLGPADTGRLHDTRSVALFVVDGSLESFDIPEGTLRRAHGPYCVKAVAEASSKDATRLSNAGLSAAFFTEPAQPGAVLDLRLSSSPAAKGADGGEVGLEWEPPEDDGGSRIHEYEVTLCPSCSTAQTSSTQSCCTRVSVADLDPSQPVRVEVRARSVGGVLGPAACVEVSVAAAGAPTASSVPACAAAPRSGSLDEPLAEPPSARDAQAAGSWLGAGWEQAYVVEASAAFEPTGDQRSTMVRVRPGDSIQVLEQHSTGWTYCKNLSLEPECPAEGGPAVSGWVPDWVVKARKARKSSKPKSKASLRNLGGSQGAAIAA